jgi:hypothetical protein
MFERRSVLLQDRPGLIREPWHWLAEQASLGLAILDEGLRWRVLPTELNFPAHVRAAASVVAGDPVIVDYHANRDAQGFLLRAALPAIDPWLDASTVSEPSSRGNLSGDRAAPAPPAFGPYCEEAIPGAGVRPHVASRVIAPNA